MVEHVEHYLAQRRQLGYALRIEGEQLLRFARFADQCAPGGRVTTELALAWANSAPRAQRYGKARRLALVTGFAKHRAVYDPATQIPPSGLLGPIHRRLAPTIYTDEMLHCLLSAARQLNPLGGLRPLTYEALFGLLASCGLRISEALALRDEDVDLRHARLTIREAKFGKSRWVGLHPSTVERLSQYRERRDKQLKTPYEPAFFLLDSGRGVGYRHVEYAFQCIRRKLGWARSPSGRWPRIHDLRHTFVCRRVLAWYQEGVSIDASMIYLSTYLGHAKITDTYWYLTGIPELMSVAVTRFEQYTSEERCS